MSAQLRTANPISRIFIPLIGSGPGEPGGPGGPTAPTASSREPRDEDDRDRNGGPTGDAFALVMAAHVTNQSKPQPAKNPPAITSASSDVASSGDGATTRVGAGSGTTQLTSSTAGPTAGEGERSTDVATAVRRPAAGDDAEVPNSKSTPEETSAENTSATAAPPVAEAKSEPVPTDLTDRLRFNTRTVTTAAGASHAMSIPASDPLSTEATKPNQSGAVGGQAAVVLPTLAETDPPTTAPTTARTAGLTRTSDEVRSGLRRSCVRGRCAH